ncbi:MAG: barstar family protein [Zoogloea sp.]|nr:barstar family protein [Zoogloea sp.]
MSAPHFHSLLTRAERAGIFRMPYAADLAIEEAAESLEYPIHRIDLSRVTTKEAFLTAVGEALAFPDWYGHNWDALADCLTDLSWMAADGYVIVLDHADTFAAACPTDFATALSIFQDAADSWREDSIPFWTLVGTATGKLDWLQDLE